MEVASEHSGSAFNDECVEENDTAKSACKCYTLTRERNRQNHESNNEKHHLWICLDICVTMNASLKTELSLGREPGICKTQHTTKAHMHLKLGIHVKMTNLVVFGLT